MLLCLDIGNSQTHGGLFSDDKLILQFRYNTKNIGSSDEFGIFLRQILKENNIDYSQILRLGIASVVPDLNYTVRAACIKYIIQNPPIFLIPGLKTGLNIKTNHPNEVGADLIAGAMAASTLYPKTDLLIFDLGTATTVCYVNTQNEFIGAAIMPGIKIMMESLHQNTAKLLPVNIAMPTSAIGRNTKSAIQSGLYYSQLGFIKEMIHLTKAEYHITQNLTTIATGGFAHLFKVSNQFTHMIPELVLLGIKRLLELNP